MYRIVPIYNMWSGLTYALQKKRWIFWSTLATGSRADLEFVHAHIHIKPKVLR